MKREDLWGWREEREGEGGGRGREGGGGGEERERGREGRDGYTDIKIDDVSIEVSNLR